MIIDSHLHLWRADPTYPNPATTIMSPVSDVPLALFEEYMAEHQIDRAVFVQPLYPGEDNSYIADCAASQPNRLAAVCVIDPTRAGAPDRLSYWVKERGCRGLRLRPRAAGQSAIFGHPDSFPLWQRAAELGTVISVLMGPEHIAALAAVAARFPSVPVVVDHLGHPDVTAGVDAPDFQRLLDLATLPNLHIKLSGFYHFTNVAYPYTDCRPLIQAIYDRFDATRLLWGSDFPHAILKTDYGRTLHVLHRSGVNFSQADLELIMGGTALRLYWGG